MPQRRRLGKIRNFEKKPYSPGRDGALNRVRLKGKVSRRGTLKYTPLGTAVYDFTLAVPQRYFDKDSVGYVEIIITGKFAEEGKDLVRVGQVITLDGALWARSFRNRQGVKVSETKVLIDSMGGENEEI